MKSTIFTLFSALILTQGVSVQAEGIFAKTFQSKLNTSAPADIKFATLEHNLDLIEADGQHNVVTPQGANISRISYCEASCGAASCDSGCDSGCGSWFSEKVCPGAGAFGGDSRFAGSITLNQDAFFGNYTTAAAGYAINNLVDVTFYTILWHTDAFAVNGANVGLWTEFGGGLNFKLLGGALNVNPQMGVLNGALLSNQFGPGGEPNVFDGIVPNIIASYNETFFESEFYMGYYLGTRGDVQNDFLHWWYNAGLKPWGENNDWKSALSMGVHYEMLRQTAPGNADNVYSWIGPYFQVALPNGLSMRYSAGWNTDNTDGNPAGLGNNFYKVNVGYDF